MKWLDGTMFVGTVLFWLIFCSQLPAANSLAARPTNDRYLTGWGSGDPGIIVPKAAAAGFTEIVVFGKNFADFIGTAKKCGIRIYAWVSLNDMSIWTDSFPGMTQPCRL